MPWSVNSHILARKRTCPLGTARLYSNQKSKISPSREQLATIRTDGVEPTDQAVFPFPVIIQYRSTQMDIGNEINLFFQPGAGGYALYGGFAH